MTGWLYLPFNQLNAESDQLIRPERDLLSSHVHLVIGEVQKIDQENRELHVRQSQGLDEIVGTGGASAAVYPYDYLGTGISCRRGWSETRLTPLVSVRALTLLAGGILTGFRSVPSSPVRV